MTEKTYLLPETVLVYNSVKVGEELRQNKPPFFLRDDLGLKKANVERVICTTRE